jgi:Nucleotidyl transferase AbiEii toxin, Type IV TA system
VRKRQELGGCDPVLLKKTIRAFALLVALAARGMDFVFKGGTSLLLRLPRIRRLSIDVDILCPESTGKLDPLLGEKSTTFEPNTTGVTLNERGDGLGPTVHDSRNLQFC